MEYLFLVSIGPVQGFIASARRTRDLAFGSWLLSELSKAAALQIVKSEGLNSLIFPAPNQQEELNFKSELNVANKIVALIQGSPKTLGEFTYGAIQSQLEETRVQAYREQKHDEIVLSKQNREFTLKQIKDLVEFQWVALPFDGSDYAGTRQQLEALMAARKNTRNFAPVTWGSNQPKSSIDGQLESVIQEDEYPSRQASEKDKFTKILRLYNKYKAGPAERLSGVDLLKRHGETIFGSSFLSTSHIAALPFLQRLELLGTNVKAQDKWNEYIKKAMRIADAKDDEVAKEFEGSHRQIVNLEKIPKGYKHHSILQDYEGSMLFEDRLTDMADIVTNQDKLNDAKKALRAFYRITDDEFKALGLSNERPNPYYAILVADGDHMGEIIDAQARRKTDELEQKPYEQHRRISQKLVEFARGVKGIIEKHQGALVYAGGDDVLAFVPLHTVLQCAHELATSFKNTLKEFTNEKGDNPTFSVGVAIIHHLEPLQDALKLARAAETRAKGVNGKNALAITISKRSGEDYTIADSWGDGSPDKGIASTLEKLIEFCRSDAIPDGTAYELRDMVRRLTVSPQDVSDDKQLKHLVETLPEVIRRDALRILQRKLYVPLGKFPKGQAKEVEKFLKERLGIEDRVPDEEKISGEEKALGEEKIPPITIEAFINELIVAQMLADAMQLAHPKPKGVKV